MYIFILFVYLLHIYIYILTMFYLTYICRRNCCNIKYQARCGSKLPEVVVRPFGRPLLLSLVDGARARAPIGRSQRRC